MDTRGGGRTHRVGRFRGKVQGSIASAGSSHHSRGTSGRRKPFAASHEFRVSLSLCLSTVPRPHLSACIHNLYTYANLLLLLLRRRRRCRRPPLFCRSSAEQVLDTPRPAAVRCRARTDNVAGVKLPVFDSYETGSEVHI